MRSWYWFLIFLLLSLSLFQIYRNPISKFLLDLEPYPFELASRDSNIRVSISAPTTYRLVKIDFPLEDSGAGCEFVYGRARWTHWNPLDRKTYTNRYIFKFAYDLKNKRCESKDLFLLTDSADQKLEFQLTQVTVEPHRVLESLLPHSWTIDFHSAPQGPPTASLKESPLNAENRMVPDRETSRSNKFSLPKLEAVDAELLVAPDQNIGNRILSEIQNRIDVCKRNRICEPIQVAVAGILDPRFIEAFVQARAVGIPVEILTNFEDPQSPFREEFERLQAWHWLRGNPFETGMKLPMHFKVIIFGNDLAISSNSNYMFTQFPTSREVAIVYRQPEIIKMFQEAVSLARTSTFYPLQVDLNDQFILLLNSERPRAYSAHSQKPFIEIISEQEISSNAYGIMYYLLDNSPEELSLVMSPITNSCAFFQKQRCFFDLIRAKANQKKMHLVLNAYFYHHQTESLWNKKDAYSAQDFEPALAEIQKIFEGFPEGLRLYSQMDKTFSTHHQRYGRVGKSWIFAGSANFAFPESLNTIEVIRKPDWALRLEAEEQTFDHPGCQHVRERDLLRPLPSDWSNAPQQCQPKSDSQVK